MRDSAAALSAALAATPPPAGNAAENTGRSRAGAVLMTLIAAIVVIGAGYATLPSWRDKLPASVQDHLAGTAAFSDALQQENSKLNTRLTDLTTRLQARDTDLGAAQSRIASMENRIAAMEKQSADLTAELKAKLADSENALAEMRAANTEGATAVSENKALKGRIAALDQLLGTEKEARAAAEALATARADATDKLTATVNEATGKIAGLEKNLDAARKAAMLAGKTDTIALAARKLRDALNGAGPFAAEIKSLKDTTGDAPAVVAALNAIEPLAATGVATRSDLFARLPGTVAAVVAADRQPKDDGWIDRTMAKLTSFVTVRRIDGKGTGTDAIVARAEIAARRGDLKAAVTEMSALTGPGTKGAADWLKSARARLAADSARTALDKIVLTGVTAGDPS